jgi:hypothetical protein
MASDITIPFECPNGRLEGCSGFTTTVFLHDGRSIQFRKLIPNEHNDIELTIPAQWKRVYFKPHFN